MSRAFTAGYVHGAEGQTTGEAMAELLDSIGCTDRVEQGQLLAALEALRGFGVQGQAASTPNGSQADREPVAGRVEQAERERDERGGTIAVLRASYDRQELTLAAAQARLASVPALVEALRTILNSAEDANQEYRRLDIALAARNALTVYEQSRGKRG